MLLRPCINQRPLWKHEIEQMLTSGTKAEIQALASLSLGYLSEVYPKGWLEFTMIDIFQPN